MFTGIVEECGVIESIRPTAKGIALTVRARICARGAKLGDSIAVNGCCLTLVKSGRRGIDRTMRFDLLRETWDRTSFAQLKAGSAVNLERSLRADSRLGGHFVTGHVDGTGTIKRWEKTGKDWLLEVSTPAEVMRYVIHKGSIAVDGISLTVAGLGRGKFHLWIIPHTRKVTALFERKAGDLVNLEADLLGKYVDQLLKLPRKR